MPHFTDITRSSQTFSLNTLQFTRNDHKRERKCRINKREFKNLRKTECTTNRIENTKKFRRKTITTYKICTATQGSQQLIYRGEIQNVIKNKLTEKERPNALMKLTTNDYVCDAQKLTWKKK